MFMAINKANWDIIKNKLTKEIRRFNRKQDSLDFQWIECNKSWFIIPAMSATFASELSSANSLV